MSDTEVILQEPQFAAFVGIDWADRKHVWSLQVAGSRQRESGEVEHKPETVEAWVGAIYANGSAIAPLRWLWSK